MNLLVKCLFCRIRITNTHTFYTLEFWITVSTYLLLTSTPGKLQKKLSKEENKMEEPNDNVVIDELGKKRIKLVDKQPSFPEKVQKFNGSYFRQLIKGENPIGGVRQFLAVIQHRNDDLMFDFINVGGSALDFVLILDKQDTSLKSSVNNVPPVFTALSIIIIKCRDELTEHIPVTEEACRRLLRMHTPLLHSMLAGSSSQGVKKVTLETLTAMVTLSLAVAQEVLCSLNLHEANTHELAECRLPDKKEPSTVRAHFMRFVLSFFYHDSTLFIKQLLGQCILLQSLIYAGLTTDEAPLLILMLTKLKDKIVEEPTITKNAKLKMFNTKIMKKLLEAYTWTGPKTKNSSKKDGIQEVTEDDQEQVLDCLDQLFNLLCTNHKLGVVFVDPTIGLDQKNYNNLVFSVVSAMDPYWNISRVRNLAMKIVLACPDLVAPTFRHLGINNAFVPNISFSFENTCKFSVKVIESLNPERSLTPGATPDQLIHQTFRVVFNMNVLKCVRDTLCHSHPYLRLLAVKLLRAVLEALKRFTYTIRTRLASSLKHLAEYSQRFNKQITEMVGLEEDLISVWSMGIKGELSLLPVPTETEYYLPLIDLLLVYHQTFPMHLPPPFLSKLHSTSLDTIDSDANDLFKIKTIKFTIIFRDIQPSQPEFAEMIETLVPLLAKHYESKMVLRSLLIQTGYFEGAECEVDSWVWNLTKFPGMNCERHVPLLKAVISEAVVQPQHCLDMIQQASDLQQQKGVVQEDFNWKDLVEAAKSSTKVISWERMLPVNRLSILVPALIRTLNKQYESCTCKFISHLLGDVLFCQVNETAFHELMRTCSSPQVQPITNYVDKWINSDDVDIFKDQPFRKRSIQYNLLNTLTSSSYSVTDPLELLGNVEPEAVPAVIRQLVFHCVRAKTCPDLLLRSVSVCRALLSTLPQAYMLPAMREVFKHPSVLRLFSPLHCPSPRNLTPLVYNLIDLVASEDRALLLPFQQRFIHQVLKVKKGKHIDCSNFNDLCRKLLTREEDVRTLLTSIAESHPVLDGWKEEVSCLVLAAASLKSCLPGSIVAVLSRHPFIYDSLAHYHMVFPHLIKHLDLDQLTCKQKQLSKLCAMVLRFDSSYSVQKRLLKNNKKRAEVVFPALAAAGPLADDSLIKQANQMIDHVLVGLACESPPNWLADHSENIGQFFTQQSDTICEDLYSCLQTQLWTITHLNIASHVYVKLGHVGDFVKKALKMLVPITTPNTLDMLKEVSKRVIDTIKDLGLEDSELEWEDMRASEAWSQWLRLALRLGETPDLDASFLLSTIKALAAHVYSQSNEGVAVIFEMAISHSQFLTVLLAKPSTTKTALLELLLCLVRLDPSVMVSYQVPIFLSSYSASLSQSDQLLLQIIQLYEEKGMHLSNWRPLMWGETAASFYSVRSHITPGLWNRETFLQQLNLFDEHRVIKTIANFPINRVLKPTKCVPAQPDIYDPAFFLPMFVSMFAPGEVVYAYKLAKTGCLSLVISALASHQRDVRMAAFVALQRLNSHLESNSRPRDMLFVHLIGALRQGLAAGRAGSAEAPRLTCVMAVFLGQAVLALTNPDHPLYLPLSQYFMAKQRFQLDTVPEFLPLFNSADVQLHGEHQEWILRVLKDGMRDSDDYKLCFKSMVFKIVLEYYSSTLASEKCKVLILELLEAAVKVELHAGQSGGQLLMSFCSLYPWLQAVVHDPHLTPSPLLLSPLIAVLSALLHKSSAALILPLLVHLTCRQPALSETELKSILAAVRHQPLPRETVGHLVATAEACVGDLFEIRAMLVNGTEYVARSSADEDDLKGYLKDIVFRLYENES